MASVQIRTRGPNLAIFVKRVDGIPIEEAISKAAGLVIASNKRLDKALVGSGEWEGIRDAFACWSGTMVGYDKPDQELGKTIEYVDSRSGIRYVFPVPEEHAGKKNVALVAEQNFTLETDGNNRIVQAETVGIVTGFPVATDRWHLVDPEYGIPHGEEVDSSNPEARCLGRRGNRVCLIARASSSRRNVVLNGRPSYGLGVAVEAQAFAVVNGIAPEDLKALCESSAGEVSARPEALEATRRLLQTLQGIK